MWTAHQNQKLKFRTGRADEPEKYGPDELLGFTVDSFTFVPLKDVRVWAESAWLGKTSRIDHLFAQRLYVGTYTVHAAHVQLYDGVSGAIQPYINVLFQRTGTTERPVPLPMYQRMKDQRFEKVKEPLYALFADQPSIVEHLRALRKEDDLGTLLALVRAIDAR